jgi:nucleotide-binding universal stress UspA family protein
LRQQAERRLQEIIAALPPSAAQLAPMVVVGRPFAEILRIANDLEYSLIVLGTHGRRGVDIEEMLFGSTAEKVIRAASIPVIVVPSTWSDVKQQSGEKLDAQQPAK